ncbi:hypothetical protein D1872_329050 [compost metagenome]
MPVVVGQYGGSGRPGCRCFRLRLRELQAERRSGGTGKPLLIFYAELDDIFAGFDALQRKAEGTVVLHV